jgi:5-methyltetrahydrofolate--homocysteine methyltransferase
MERREGEWNQSLADYVAPQATGLQDHIGAFAVSSGFGLKALVEEYKSQLDDYHVILAEAVADRLAEAFAEYLHARVREEWGIQEHLSVAQCLAEEFQGIRPAAGYPACPDHSEKQILWRLLEVEKHTGILLTESGAMWPGSSISGLYFAHPRSRYFGLGKIGRDQVHDYHIRKGMTLQEVEKWLAMNLNYEPGGPSPTGVCGCGIPH